MKKSLLLLPLLILGIYACRVNRVPPAEAAKGFAAQLNIPLRGPALCAGVDTDNDGYVTCTLSVGTAEAPRLMSIQCAATEGSNGCAPVTYAEGCKETMPQVAGPQ